MGKFLSKRILMGAILFMLASSVYLIAEAISAQAWTNPEYSYSFHYISDLGVSKRLLIDDGREVYSPLAGVMNTGFILYGILSAGSYIAVLPLIKDKAKWSVLSFALIQGVGNVLVGLFPGETYDYASMHIIGAAMAIVGGNCTLLLMGIYLKLKKQGYIVKAIALLLGNFGLIMLVTFLLTNADHSAVFERLSVYTMTAWNLIFGFWLIKKYKIQQYAL